MHGIVTVSSCSSKSRNILIRQEVMIKALNFFLKYVTAIKPNETLCMGLSQFLAAAPNHVIY